MSNFHYSVCLKYYCRWTRISLKRFVTMLTRDILFIHPVFLKASNRFVNNVEGRIMVLWGRRRRRRQRQNGCVTSLRHHNDVRSLTTNSIIDRHYFSSVSFRTLVLEQQWSNACNILPSLLFFSHFYVRTIDEN